MNSTMDTTCALLSEMDRLSEPDTYSWSDAYSESAAVDLPAPAEPKTGTYAGPDYGRPTSWPAISDLDVPQLWRPVDSAKVFIYAPYVPYRNRRLSVYAGRGAIRSNARVRLYPRDETWEMSLSYFPGVRAGLIREFGALRMHAEFKTWESCTARSCQRVSTPAWRCECSCAGNNHGKGSEANTPLVAEFSETFWRNWTAR